MPGASQEGSESRRSSAGSTPARPRSFRLTGPPGKCSVPVVAVREKRRRRPVGNPPMPPATSSDPSPAFWRGNRLDSLRAGTVRPAGAAVGGMHKAREGYQPWTGLGAVCRSRAVVRVERTASLRLRPDATERVPCRVTCLPAPRPLSLRGHALGVSRRRAKAIHGGRTRPGRHAPPAGPSEVKREP